LSNLSHAEQTRALAFTAAKILLVFLPRLSSLTLKTLAGSQTVSIITNYKQNFTGEPCSTALVVSDPVLFLLTCMRSSCHCLWSPLPGIKQVLWGGHPQNQDAIAAVQNEKLTA
jgi:hypothetical protein